MSVFAQALPTSTNPSEPATNSGVLKLDQNTNPVLSPANAPLPTTQSSAAALAEPTPAPAPVQPTGGVSVTEKTETKAPEAAPTTQSPSASTAADVQPGAVAAAAVKTGEAEGKKAETELAYFDKDRLPIAIVIVVILSLVTYYTLGAQKGKEMFIRRIGGLSAIDDAVGRATEMGKGVLFIPGIYDMDDIQTIAGVTIMGHVAKKTAEYDTPLFAPMTRSFVMSVAQEVVKQSYIEKGRPDAFRADRINYITDDQFGYVASVGGVMMREKPAACFYLGVFYAESLILAETGNSVGAIQIAGTAESAQIPFFVAACDYTLIGEELFAASAYLSKNPKEVGSLKGQDMCKLIIIAAMIIGTLLVSVTQTEWGQSSDSLKRITEKYMSFLNIE